MIRLYLNADGTLQRVVPLDGLKPSDLPPVDTDAKQTTLDLAGDVPDFQKAQWDVKAQAFVAVAPAPPPAPISDDPTVAGLLDRLISLGAAAADVKAERTAAAAAAPGG